MKPLLDNILCLDFEASALGQGSYPIEAALADVATDEVYAALIRPTGDWLRDGVWAHGAAAVHNIKQAELLKDGIDASEVAAELRRRARGKHVLSDAPDHDGFCFAELYHAAGMATAFALFDFDVFAWQLAARVSRRPDIAYVKSELEAQTRFPRTHRAGDDARSLAELLRLIAGLP